MGVVNSNKEINKTEIECDDTFNVKLSITAPPDIVSDSTDIVLVIDRSGSMSCNPILNLKNGTKNLQKLLMKQQRKRNKTFKEINF